MSSIPGYTAQQLSAWKQNAAMAIAYYDQNHNGGIDQDELEKFAGKVSETRDNYWVGNFCNRTYTFYDVFRRVDGEKLKALDADQDGKVTVEELHAAHLAALPKRDLNGDGKATWWEKVQAKGVVPAVESLIGETRRRVVTSRVTKNVYSPGHKERSKAPKF
jgi:hypothetical protein